MGRHHSTTGLDPRTDDLTGRTFERLTVIRFDSYRNYRAYWLCQCTCGTQKSVAGASLKNGCVQSCTCQKNEKARLTHTTHGKYGTPEHTSWGQMIQRCYNPRNRAYHNYGGRGITVCDAWRNSFEAFYHDMGPRQSPRHTLERINNDNGYYKENCCWATDTEQSRNRRNSRMLTFQGRTQCLAAWAEEFHIKQHTLAKRLKEGWSIDDALAVPVSTANIHAKHKHKVHNQLKLIV